MLAGQKQTELSGFEWFIILAYKYYLPNLLYSLSPWMSACGPSDGCQAEFGIKGCRGNKYYNLVSPRGPFTLILQMPIGRRVFLKWREFGWCCLCSVNMLGIRAAAAGWAWGWRKGEEHCKLWTGNCWGKQSFPNHSLTKMWWLCIRDTNSFWNVSVPFFPFVILTYFWDTGHSFLFSVSRDVFQSFCRLWQLPSQYRFPANRLPSRLVL